MKTKSVPTPIRLALILLLGASSLLHVNAQNPLDPPGPPADTMKTLQDIWDKLQQMEGQQAALEGQVEAIQGAGVVSIEMVTVGNAGNGHDLGNTSEPNSYGGVPYEYRIGKYEVTNAEYAAFLNAVAAEDTLHTSGLYEPSMGSGLTGGITRSGASPNYTYAVKAFMGDKPVNYVSFFDAIRFCNWLHNGQLSGAQGVGTTEGGAYNLIFIPPASFVVFPGTDPIHGANGRMAGARFHLPSENEWYKAAYHEPGASGDDYWLYPTRSDSLPTQATADPFGNINNDTASPPGIANYGGGASWNGANFCAVTTVGSGGAGSQSFYGAADMGGNVWEWNEQDISGNRGRRGGAACGPDAVGASLQSSFRANGLVMSGGNTGGFRVAGPR